jgi:hypothetical protein
MQVLRQVVLIACVWVVDSFAQTAEVTVKPLTDSDIQLLRQNLQAEKNDIITKTMAFSEAESAKFWPVYRRYASAQQKIGDQRVALIKEYAKSYPDVEAAKAHGMVEKMFQIDNASLKLREEYLPQFESALGPVRAMRFYQVDSRLSQMINLQLATEIPLVH